MIIKIDSILFEHHKRTEFEKKNTIHSTVTGLSSKRKVQVLYFLLFLFCANSTVVEFPFRLYLHTNPCRRCRNTIKVTHNTDTSLLVVASTNSLVY